MKCVFGFLFFGPIEIANAKSYGHGQEDCRLGAIMWDEGYELCPSALQVKNTV
jgi:hypothetical protein